MERYFDYPPPSSRPRGSHRKPKPVPGHPAPSVRLVTATGATLALVGGAVAVGTGAIPTPLTAVAANAPGGGQMAVTVHQASTAPATSGAPFGYAVASAPGGKATSPYAGRHRKTGTSPGVSPTVPLTAAASQATMAPLATGAAPTVTATTSGKATSGKATINGNVTSPKATATTQQPASTQTASPATEPTVTTSPSSAPATASTAPASTAATPADDGAATASASASNSPTSQPSAWSPAPSGRHHRTSSEPYQESNSDSLPPPTSASGTDGSGTDASQPSTAPTATGDAVPASSS